MTEHFGLVWPGKARALRLAQSSTNTVLVPDVDGSKDWAATGNVFVEGDNLEALKILQREYAGLVDVIYIDPPYNTGKDFVYTDRFQQSAKQYRESVESEMAVSEQAFSAASERGRFHSRWLSMMYPRLTLARTLMAENGTIFISIDDNELHHLKLLCDEVFGEANHLNTLVWINNLKGRQIAGTGAAGTKEYVLVYTRDVQFAQPFVGSASTLKQLMPDVYKGASYTIHSDEMGQFVVKNELHNTNSAFNEETRPNLVFDIYYNPGTGEVRTEDLSPRHVHPGFVKIAPKRNNNGVHRYHAFRWSRDKVEAEASELLFKETHTGWKVFTKVRDVDAVTFKDLFLGIPTTRGSADLKRIGLDAPLFNFPKPVDLVKTLVGVAGAKDSLVLDFFAGSSTTAHAVMSLNAEDGGTRRFVMVQWPEPTPKRSAARKAGFGTIADISRERILRAGIHIEKEFADALALRDTPLDTGFRAYKLAPERSLPTD